MIECTDNACPGAAPRQRAPRPRRHDPGCSGHEPPDVSAWGLRPRHRPDDAEVDAGRRLTLDARIRESRQLRAHATQADLQVGVMLGDRCRLDCERIRP